MVCQGVDYTGDYTGLGHTSPNGTETHVGMTPESGNTLIGTTASAFSFKMKLSGSPTNPVVGAQIYNNAGVLQATSTNTIADLDGTFTFREFTFSSNFTVTQDFKYVIYLVSGSVDDSNRVDINGSSGVADNNIGPYKTASGWWNYTLPFTICFTVAVSSGGTRLPPPPITVRF